LTATALASIALVALTACSSPAPEPVATVVASDYDAATLEALGGDANAAYLDELYQKAVAAGQKTITVYGITATSSASLYAAFSKRYPEITVNHVTVFGAELQSKIAAEQATGKYVADNVSVSGADASFVVDNDYVEKIDVPAAADLDKRYKPAGDTLFGGNTYIYTVSYNTDLVKEADAPTTFAELADPALAGKIGIVDPKIGMTGFIAAGIDDGKVKESYIDKIKALNPVIFPSERDLFTAVSTGQIEYGIGNYVRGEAFLKVDNLPVGFVPLFKDGVADGVFYRGTVKNAPNALASDLLVNWWLTPEAQNLISIQGQYGLMPGAPAVPGQPPFEELTINPGPKFADFGPYLTKYNDMFKKHFG
jgi:iron(III) transport system substrate-binding protein